MMSRNREQEGFTVAELIVAMTISAITLLSGYECFMALKAAGDRQSEDLAATGGIVHGLGQIREDLLHSLVLAGASKPTFVGCNPAVEGEAGATQVLSFYSLCPRQGDGPARSLRRVCQVSYDWVKTRDSIRLYRNAAPVVGPNPTSNRELILDGVEQMQIAFYSGETSKTRFSSEKELPARVDVVVTVHGQIWLLSVKLPCGGSKESA
jgi:prepilin-type N-terminal cleavage/methylation domain-containing protein